METWIDIIRTVIVSMITFGLAALLPFLLKLRGEKVEHGKIKAESGSLGADTALKFIEAADKLQAMNAKVLSDMSKRNQENKEYIEGLVIKLGEVQKQNQELQAQTQEHTRLLEEAQKNSIAQQGKIDQLIKGVRLLQEQVEKLGGIPIWQNK